MVYHFSECEARTVYLKGALRYILSFPVIERFCLPPDAKVVYKDATGTEVDEVIFSDLISQGTVVLTVFSSDGEKFKGANSTPDMGKGYVWLLVVPNNQEHTI